MELRYGHVISFTRRLGDLLVRSGPKSTICFEHGRWPRVVFDRAVFDQMWLEAYIFCFRKIILAFDFYARGSVLN